MDKLISHLVFSCSTGGRGVEWVIIGKGKIMDLILHINQLVGITGIIIALLAGFIAIFKGLNPRQIFSVKGVRLGLEIFYVSVVILLLIIAIEYAIMTFDKIFIT